MQNVMKNKSFTLVFAILPALLAVFFLLGALRVRKLDFARDVLRLFSALMLLLYVFLVLLRPLVAEKNKSNKIVRGIEIGFLFLVMLLLVASQFLFDVPLLGEVPVCTAVGLVLAARGIAKLLHAYFAEQKMPLSRYCLYLLLTVLGIWQVAKPAIPDKYFLFFLSFVAIFMAGFFTVLTVRNVKAEKKNGSAAALAEKNNA